MYPADATTVRRRVRRPSRRAPRPGDGVGGAAKRGSPLGAPPRLVASNRRRSSGQRFRKRSEALVIVNGFIRRIAGGARGALVRGHAGNNVSRWVAMGLKELWLRSQAAKPFCWINFNLRRDLKEVVEFIAIPGRC